ncbi:tRNA nuclease WapA precursor [Pirellula sp. SH-Sr6A]|uniref:RHS repeat-associated core domain-containing protein n=1 Tax=Pirellula sp. SH-Sr6A TaxID=1632865 RepID=UPI00078ECC5E|nr:RHS repeat-associated core domain-containing protein [Pirellula sp. SH-Sr6A]AMV32618.1 tRNA nuclease WapA precursor [Pirellula sp. SH-Sr6A]
MSRLTQVIDGRGTETRYEYDGQGRETTKKAAYGTSIEARTDTFYDLAGNVTEVRHPRYFDSSDTEGYQKAKETWTYNGRGLVASHTDATGSSIAATESFTYDLGGHQATRTDFGGNVWTRYEDSCCEKKTANADPLGHGTIVNTDSNGRTVHTIQVSDVSTHVGSFSNPTDAKTLSESTTKFDGRGRVIYQTTWLSARGTVDPANPPIAGIGGVSLSDGLTTQYLYDDNLADGVGLDNSTGVSVSKLGTGGSGTFNVSLSNAISKLASTEANGGANVTFSSTAPGKATVVISPEDEISFTISDAAGRSVMSGKLNNYRGSGSTALNTLATWNCTVYDATTSLSGYGTVLVTKSVDPQGNTTASWTDAAGRTLRSIDQLGKVTTMTFDAAGNQLSVRDPNNVGADMLYDALGRNTQRTDTNSAVTKTEYDKAGNAIKQTDAKNKHTYITFDARGRRKSTTDRISAVTSFTYTALGQLASLTDAESQTTSYTYDSRGSKLTETYPDHTSGTSPGQTGYGIVTFVYDNAGRVKRKQDQLGDTVTFTFDLAGRMTTKDYRTAANSPTGTIADSDTFTFDRAGRMLTAASGRYSNTVTYTFDPIGRKATEALTIGGQTYTITSEYNSRGELTTVTYPDSSISERTYHATGALNQLKLDGSTISTRTYDDGRRLTGETLGNGVTESRTYASDNLLTAISYGGTGTSIGNLSYTWDSNKNKTSETIGGTMSNYGFTSAGTSYDDEDRLTGFARASGTFTQSWSLTSVGDWNSITTNGTAQNRTHGPTHELLTAGGQNVTTDVKGNITLLPTTLTTSGVAMSVGYDFDNKLKSADVDNNGSNDVTFQYDALGRRVARQGTSGSFVYVQHDQQTIADYGYGDAPSSPTHRYVYASYIDEPVVRKAAGTSGTIHYYHRNQQYSITAITTSSGSVAERYAYTAYGQPTILDGSGSVLSSSAINNRYTYTGREWDQSLGLYHFRARWMSGLAGRFMGRDPIGYFGSPFGLYRQFQGYALVVLDPHGSEVITAGAVGVGGVIVAGGTSTTTVIVSGGTSTLVGGTTIGGSVGTGSGIIGIVSSGGAAATGGGTAAAVGGSTAAGGGTVLISGGLATTVGVAVLPGGILGYGIYATPVIGTQNWLEPGLTQVAYYFFPSNHPPVQTSTQPKPFPVPVPVPKPRPKCDDERELCEFTGKWAPMDFCEYRCSDGYVFTVYPHVHQEFACDAYAPRPN